MPRFYFDVHDGEQFMADEEGSELDGVEAAQREATETLAALAASRLPKANRRDMAIEVRDEAGQPLLKTQLSFAVQRVR